MEFTTSQIKALRHLREHGKFDDEGPLHEGWKSQEMEWGLAVLDTILASLEEKEKTK